MANPMKAKPLEGKLAPVLVAGKKRGPCPACKAVDWVERPDGTAVCGHCVAHAGTFTTSSNCKICLAWYWEEYDARLKKLREQQQQRRAA